MSDPVYQPPKTDPTLKGEIPPKPHQPPTPKMSTRALLIYTFLPSVLLLISIPIMPFFIPAILMFYVSPILGFVFSLITTVEHSSGKGALTFFGYWALYLCVHAILLFLALAIGCGGMNAIY